MKIVGLASKNRDFLRLFGLMMLWMGVRVISGHWQCYLEHLWKLLFFENLWIENFLSYVARQRRDFGAKPVFRGISMVVRVFYRNRQNLCETIFDNLYLSWDKNGKNMRANLNYILKKVQKHHYIMWKDSPDPWKPSGKKKMLSKRSSRHAPSKFLSKNILRWF